jgi:hypothetical protein
MKFSDKEGDITDLFFLCHTCQWVDIELFMVYFTFGLLSFRISGERQI